MISGPFPTSPGAAEVNAAAASLPDGGELRPVGDLERHGIQKVKLIRKSDFEGAVRDAVAQELLAVLPDLRITDAFRERLEARAVARLRGDAALSPTRTVETPPPSRPEPVSLPEGSAPTTDTAPSSPEPDFDFEAMEARMLESIGRLVSENWREELRSAQDSQRHQVSRLETRIDSLMRALDQVEHLMEDPSAAPLRQKTFIDGRALGGIKQELLEQLFQTNLALREIEVGEDIAPTTAGEDATDPVETERGQTVERGESGC